VDACEMREFLVWNLRLCEVLLSHTVFLVF